MKFETIQKRSRTAEVLAKEMLEKAQARSVVVNGKVEWAFVAGYLESVLSNVASESPSSLKRLKAMVEYK